MSDGKERVRIEVADRSNRLAAIDLLHQDEDAESRARQVADLLKAARYDDSLLENLIVARRGNLTVGAAWALRMPGGTASMRPPRLNNSEPYSTLRQLIQCLEDRLADQGVQLMQAAVRQNAERQAADLKQVGFSYAAELCYLVCEGDRLHTKGPAFANVEFESFTLGQRSRLANLLERTYVATLDVPSLDGIRKIDDVIDGYQQTGDFLDQNWFFVRHQRQDVGCLLLNEHSAQRQFELVYMGLVPEARGNGWGAELVEQAKRVTLEAGHDRMILAVDALNIPALQAYSLAGCFEFDRRAVFLKVLGE